MRDLTDEIFWGTDESGIWLARREDAVEVFDLTPQRLGEVVPILESKSVDTNDLGNGSTTLVLGVTRQHATPGDCRYFIMSHAKAIAGLDPKIKRPLLVRYHTGEISEFTIPNAILLAYPSQQLGSTSRTTYQLSGGAVQ